MPVVTSSLSFRRNDSDGMEREVREKESFIRHAPEKVSDFFRAVLIEQTFEPNVRVDKIHGQSPRHSSAFRCNCNDVN